MRFRGLFLMNLQSEPAPKSSRAETDGRWPFSAQKPANKSRATSAADPARKSGHSSLNMTSQHVMTSSFGPSSLHKSLTSSFSPTSDGRSALEMYGTLPRRKKKDAPDSPVLTRSNSREPSLNRAATLRRQTSRDKEPSSKSLPPYPRGRRPPVPRTLILHETAVQTNLTGEDLDLGVPLMGSGHKTHTYVQTESKTDSESLEKLQKVTKDYLNALERMHRLLGPDKSREISSAVLDDVEKLVVDLNRTVIKQREDIFELHTLNTVARRDVEKCQMANNELIDQQKRLEVEHTELQDFLQTETSMLNESLCDTNQELSRLKEELKAKDIELGEQQDQCKHLVRLAEQRRQENLSLETRLSGLEQRSHDVMRQQGAAVSGAAVALTSLGARLDSLVDQLAVSYNVADKDLEDVIYHNEAYSPDASPEATDPSDGSEQVNIDCKPVKKTSWFLNAVLSAIRSAGQTPSSGASRKASSAPLTTPEPNSDSLGLLDSELALDPLSKSSESVNEAGVEPASSSIHNLSAAILQRQRTEEEEACKSLDTALPPDINCLVDQVIQVDNLVTKLLKVMRIVQMDNDVCLDQIADQRAELDERLRLESHCREEAEGRLQRLEGELQEARGQLNARIKQLEDAKLLLTDSWQRESQRQYTTIDHALETLQSMQEVVDQFPPLVKLQQRLEDCNFRTASGDDLNANSTHGQLTDNERTNGKRSDAELTNGSPPRATNN